jgi:1-acyl-sn-glycerol-3-phosphate acyltransferase
VVRGMDRFDPDRNYVMVSNHASYLDPAAIVSVLPQKIRFLAKRELLWVPVFGVAAWATGNVFVKREKKGSARRTLQEAAAQVGPAISVLFFAEGTRTLDGSLGAFKPGAAQMALSTQVPVLPMALAGTAAIFPRGGAPIRAGTVGLAVGKPIPVAGRTTREREAFTAEVRAAVEALLPEAEAARAEGTGDLVFPGS